MQRLLNSLNLCIRAHFSELLNQQEAWFTVGPPAVLNIERVCKGIDHAAFVMTLWVGDPVCAMCEFMDRLNIVMVMLDQFFDYTMPWWWLWSVVPFNGFLPMDQVLKNYSGLSGEDLYNAYQKEARAHWEKAPGVFFNISTAWETRSGG